MLWILTSEGFLVLAIAWSEMIKKTLKNYQKNTFFNKHMRRSHKAHVATEELKVFSLSRDLQNLVDTTNWLLLGSLDQIQSFFYMSMMKIAYFNEDCEKKY